jgi:hypothetical protein
MGQMWWFYIKMELAAERAELLRAQANNEQPYDNARDHDSVKRERRAELDQRKEFDQLVAPIARHFARLDRSERHGRTLAGFAIVATSFVGLLLATAFDVIIAGLMFFGLALYGTNIVINEFRNKI